MTGVRVLVGTKKGAFIFKSDGDRGNFDVSGPFFGGWEIYHMKGSSLDPDLIFASQSTGWFGQIIQRSQDGGTSWETVSNQFAYEGNPHPHQWYDGSPHPWEFARVWHLEPSLYDRSTVFAGVEDAAIFRSDDLGESWSELPGLRGHGTASSWQPGAGGLCLHTILQHPTDRDRLFVAVSAAGAFRTSDGGANWEPINKGLRAPYLPDEDVEVGHCVHRIALHPSRPDVLYMQKHWDVMRSDDAGSVWREISGNLPSDFGFVVDVDPNDPETVFVIPILSDSEHFPPDHALRVFRSRSGGDQWEALTSGLPQENFYGDVLRAALATDSFDPCGVYFGTTTGELYASFDGGDSFTALAEHLPAVLSVEVQTLP